MKSAKEFWKEKFDEYPQTDAEKLAVTMMAEYALDSKWILVNDELPKKDGNSSIDCLTYDKHHNQIRVLSFNEHHHCWDDEDGDDYYTDAVGGKVSHWMSLPSRPENNGVV